MSLDLDAILRAAVAAEVQPLRDEVRALRTALEARVEGRHLTVSDIGKRLGKSPDACRMWLKRRGKALAAMAFDVGGQRMWRAEDVDAFMSRKGGAR